MPWEVGIEDVSEIFRDSLCLHAVEPEPLGKSRTGVGGSALIDDRRLTFHLWNPNTLHVFQMDSKSLDSRKLAMSAKFEETPHCLRGTDKPGVDVLDRLVSLNGGCNTVAPLEDVLEHVLDGPVSRHILHVDMATVFPRKPLVVRYDPSIVIDKVALANLAAIVSTAVDWHPLVLQDGCISKFFGKVLAANAIRPVTLHARRLWIPWTTRTVEHHLGHHPKQLWLMLFARQLGRDDLIQRLGISWFRVGMHDEEKMHVRQPALLILDGKGVGDALAKHVFLCHVVEQNGHLEAKNAGYQIWTVVGQLSG